MDVEKFFRTMVSREFIGVKNGLKHHARLQGDYEYFAPFRETVFVGFENRGVEAIGDKLK